MSLFKSKECWSAVCRAAELNFKDNFSICVANIDNNSDELNKIVVGGHSGALFVFLPCANTKIEDSAGSCNLLFESQLSLPILQLVAGKFVSSSDNIYLAILHSRKLTIYGISCVSGNVSYGSQYQINVIYEHNLERSAFNIVVGPFGRVNAKDFICVLSLDGTLSFFEQESYTFSCFLPNSLIPSPFGYNSKSDSFIIATSAYCLENYKYQALAFSSSNKNPTSNQKLTVDWSFNLGESIIDISVIILKSGSSLIYVLSDRHIFCFKENGSLSFLKKLEFHPSCFYVYINGDEDDVFYIITSHTKMAMIYNDISLKWATQIPFVPTFISRIDLQDFKNCLLLLSEDGHLSCIYLGTNPAIYSTFPSKTRPINIIETNKELENLNKIIAASQKSGTSTHIINKSEAQLTVTAIVNNTAKQITNGEFAMGMAPHFEVMIILKSISSIQNVQVDCYLENSFSISKSKFYFLQIVDPLHVTVDVSLREGFIPSSLQLLIIAVYSNAAGSAEISKTRVTLPLKAVVTTCPPSKDAEFKTTICINKEPVKLDELFPDFVSINETGSGQVIGFQYYGGPLVSILMAKTSHRYRLQSDNFECLSLVLSEMLSRLEKWFTSSKNHDKLICSYQNDIPLPEFYLIVNTHLQNRYRFDMYTKKLSQLASQIRAIQKRLLLKYKDKAATPLMNLDSLLESTFNQMSTLMTTIESHKIVLERSLTSAIAASRLICLLLKLYSNMDDAEFELLSKVMCANLNDEDEQCWEEVVTAGLETLLQTSFCKGVAKSGTVEVKLIAPENLEYFKKQLAGVIDFVTRGALIEEADEQAQIQPTANFAEENVDTENALIGAKFGERILMESNSLSEFVKEISNDDANLKSNSANDNSTDKDLEYDKTIEKTVINNEPDKSSQDIIELYEKLPEISTTAYEVHDFLDEF